MQRFFVPFAVFCLIAQVSGTFKCYDNNIGSLKGEKDNCYYCSYVNITSSDDKKVIYSNEACITVDSPNIVDGNLPGGNYNKVNHCYDVTDQNFHVRVYVCDKELCNDKCSATGYALGFGLLIACIAKFFI
ncbi:hypothetical protein FO519_003958 [Halicephalobus sp. NKZ332]|nr:hypothetical protein FO519_003958 [Halicephalobus sp. NKZ332]